MSHLSLEDSLSPIYCKPLEVSITPFPSPFLPSAAYQSNPLSHLQVFLWKQFWKIVFPHLVTFPETWVSFKCRWPDDPVFFFCLSLLLCNMGIILPRSQHHCEQEVQCGQSESHWSESATSWAALPQAALQTRNTMETPSLGASFTRGPWWGFALFPSRATVFAEVKVILNPLRSKHKVKNTQ